MQLGQFQSHELSGSVCNNGPSDMSADSHDLLSIVGMVVVVQCFILISVWLFSLLFYRTIRAHSAGNLINCLYLVPLFSSFPLVARQHAGGRTWAKGAQQLMIGRLVRPLVQGGASTSTMGLFPFIAPINCCAPFGPTGRSVCFRQPAGQPVPCS